MMLVPAVPKGGYDNQAPCPVSKVCFCRQAAGSVSLLHVLEVQNMFL